MITADWIRNLKINNILYKLYKFNLPTIWQLEDRDIGHYFCVENENRKDENIAKWERGIYDDDKIAKKSFKRLNFLSSFFVTIFLIIIKYFTVSSVIMIKSLGIM